MPDLSTWLRLVLLVTVDGRQPGISTGMTLEMLAELLLEFGAIEAMNLDGGVPPRWLLITRSLTDLPIKLASVQLAMRY